MEGMNPVSAKITVHAVITREDGSREELDLLLDQSSVIDGD